MTIKLNRLCDTAINEMKEQHNTQTHSPQSNKSALKTRNEKHGISFGAIIFFILCLAVAVTLLIAAAVMWLAEILGSIALSCLIFGGAAIIIAMIVYFASVRRSAGTLQEYLDTVYETSSMVKSGYERIKSWVELIFD